VIGIGDSGMGIDIHAPAAVSAANSEAYTIFLAYELWWLLSIFVNRWKIEVYKYLSLLTQWTQWHTV
jgi:hypothetical protein